MSTLEIIKQKASFLNNLSNSEAALFDYINNNPENLDEVIIQYKPEREFKPVNTLRFLIANELKKGIVIDANVINELKQAIENRDVSVYFELNQTVKQSLLNYKNSKKGMFPNWGHTFKVLFPFLYNAAENAEVNLQLERFADEIIQANQLENVTKHIVSFQGSNKYGSDHAWVAIIPETAPSVQYAYQIFFTINKNGVVGGLHKGHNLTKQVFTNQDILFNTWEDYIEHTKQAKDQWSQLNSEVNFIFLNDEQAFVKVIKKVDDFALSNYFKTLDRLKEDLDIQDEEKLVFSIASNRLSFHVGKRYCLNVNKKLFDFISYNELEGDTDRETFTGSDIAYFYKGRTVEEVLSNYEDIKSAIETEIERDNHALAKTYDNSAFRKAVFDMEYRDKFIQNIGVSEKTRNYWALGFNSNEERLNLFKEEGYWQALDYPKDDLRNAAKRARKLFDQIETGDYIVIKGYGGSHDLIVHFKAEVLSKDFENERLELNKLDGSLYKGKAPKGLGAGNWHDTILQINREEDIKLLFENFLNMKSEFINWMIEKSNPNYFGNDILKWDKYLEDSLEHFDKNIFECTASNYKAIIELIDETINSDKELFLKAHGAKDSGKLAAILGKDNYSKFLVEKFHNQQNVVSRSSSYSAPLNQIFYGPPGTGKTYNTILEAAKIITHNSSIGYHEAQDVFNLHLGDRIEFITFHQNYSYEDFIQGLRPDTEAGGELSFFKSDGVFKRIADRALKNLKDSENPEYAKREFEDVFFELTKPLNEGEVAELEIKMKQTSFYLTEVGEKSIEFRKNQGDSKHTLSINTLRKMYDLGTNDIILGGLQPYYNPILSLLLDKGKKDVVRVEKQNYVIIIDEINRANISRVFGELITLIEEDKRSHGKLPIKATLPSGEQFIVPSNLFIIGTMNTADKSIALLDIALRRRFEFKSMYPKYEIPNKIVHHSVFLKKLNDLIVDSGKGHDFTIGHSYFMCEEEASFAFETTINNKVIPLMLEYYMNDENEIKSILDEALKEQGLKVGNWPLEVLSND